MERDSRPLNTTVLQAHIGDALDDGFYQVDGIALHRGLHIEREHAHAALVALLAARGVDYLRVHDVRATRDALAVVAAMEGHP